ncbi:MAG TPA: hypothetical protein VLT16_00620, partial [Candidatus Limnocylindrales bacterium]|nr:hypothetical protein [Candidatus Limnocylindrales bacterium]
MGGSSKGGGSGSQMRNYFGSIGGVVCAGPVDELLTVLIDSTLAWPPQRPWGDGVDALQVVEYMRSGGVATVFLAQVPMIYKNDNFILTGMNDPSFNCAGATAVNSVYGAFVSYGNAGPDVAWTVASSGALTKVLAYVVNNIVSRAGELYQCTTPHSGVPGTAPPNITYWKRWSIKRSEQPNPYAFTIPNRGHAYFYWGTDNQTLRVGGVLSKNDHPAYRNQALIELEGFLFGIERTTAPNVEVVVRKAPAQTIVVDAAADLDVDGQANPAVVALELMTNPLFGAGLDPGMFDP